MTEILRLNKACKFFPCHTGLEDCTFCYCPFYPCGNAHRGTYISVKGRKKIWSCKDCNWIHKKKVVDKIFSLICKESIKTVPVNAYNDGSNKTAVIILSHGSKVKKASRTIRKIIKEIKSNSELKIIEPSYLQFRNPNLAASVKKLVKNGYKRILIVPFFLFTGIHVSKDVPKEIRREAGLYKNVEFVYARNIGSDPRIKDIVLDCIREAL